MSTTPSMPKETNSRHVSALPGGLTLFLIAVVLLGLKSPDSLSHAQFWAEDGMFFFREQYAQLLPRLLTPYAGYLHVIPRLVAWIARDFDVSRAPMVYNASALLIGAGCVAYTTRRLADLFPWCSR